MKDKIHFGSVVRVSVTLQEMMNVCNVPKVDLLCVVCSYSCGVMSVSEVRCSCVGLSVGVLCCNSSSGCELIAIHLAGCSGLISGVIGLDTASSFHETDSGRCLKTLPCPLGQNYSVTSTSCLSIV